MRKLTWFLVLVFQFVIVSPASAHRPDKGIDLGITAIPDPQTSYAYYRELTLDSPIHVYQLSMQAGDFFHAGINIPQLDRLQDYEVEMLLLGPGLPGFTVQNNIPVTGEDASLDQSLQETISNAIDLIADNAGGILAPSQVSEPFFEPFTQTNYWGRQVLELDAPQNGDYYLIVWNPDGQPGKYVLDTGTEEVFGLGDIFRFPVWWFETRLYFEQGPQLAFYAALAVIGVAALMIIRRSRRLAADKA